MSNIRNKYLLVIQCILILVVDIYSLFYSDDLAEPSAKEVLLLALYLGVIVIRSLISEKYAAVMYVLLTGLTIWLNIETENQFILLAAITYYEAVIYIKVNIILYFVPCIALMFMDVTNMVALDVIIIMIGIIYYLNNSIIQSFLNQKYMNLETEQKLKSDINHIRTDMNHKLHNSKLKAENDILDEKSKLVQRLHDNLGHSINGSIYQLEAAKVMIDKDTQDTNRRIQAVIDQLRTVMEDIRHILREERPDRYKLAKIQLFQLCEECEAAGIEASLEINGELSDIPDTYLEIILDNVYEAITNSMKYSGCNNIIINLHIMNKMIRCLVKDNGVGCKEIIDGIGISGMRQRIRKINGSISFESEMGFTINMLLPIE